MIHPADDAEYECAQCKSVEDLHWGPDPFAWEINDDLDEMWLCPVCWQESADDI